MVSTGPEGTQEEKFMAFSFSCSTHTGRVLLPFILPPGQSMCYTDTREVFCKARLNQVISHYKTGLCSPLTSLLIQSLPFPDLMSIICNSFKKLSMLMLPDFYHALLMTLLMHLSPLLSGEFVLVTPQ